MTAMQKAFQQALKDADNKALAHKVQRALSDLASTPKPLTSAS